MKFNDITQSKSLRYATNDYLCINLRGKLHVALAHNDIFSLQDITDNLTNHSSYYSALFYIADTCTRDINRARLQNNERDKAEEISKSIYLLNEIPRNQNYELVLKYDIFVSDIQFDLLEFQPEDDYNPFDTFMNSQDKDFKEDQNEPQDQEESRLALLSFIVESTKVNFSMIENSALENNVNITKIDISVKDWLLVNELFNVSPDLSASLNKNQKVIPLHPKLFDIKENYKDDTFEEYDSSIENILQYNPERVLVYWQRGKKYNKTGLRLDWLELSLFTTTTNKQNSIDQYLETGDILVNIYKSLNTKLTFEWFWKYTEQLYLPQIETDGLLDCHFNGFILQANSLHEWSKYIPPYHEYPQQSDLAFKLNTKFLVKVYFDEIAIDYTPCVTNTTWLEVYKNYDYNIKKDEQDESSDEDCEDPIYKTNTRTIVAFDINLKAKIEPDNGIIDMTIKINDLTAYLLWTSQYSPKWSSDLLIDDKHSITSMYNQLLTKMGFVNIASIKEMELKIFSEPADMEQYINQQKSKSIASLNENLSNKYEIPYMSLLNQSLDTKSSQIVDTGIELIQKLTVKVDLFNISIYLCRDSIWGLYLLSECANLHINESMKWINKKMRNPKKNKSSKKAKFSNVISEIQEDSSESDKEESKKFEYLQGIKFDSEKLNIIDDYIESSTHISELPMKKKISDYMKESLEDTFDIIGVESKVKDDFEEGEVRMFGEFDISTDHINMIEQNSSKSIANLTKLI